MTGSDRKLCFDEKERGKVCRDYMERIMNEENEWKMNVEGEVVECLVDCVGRDEVVQFLDEMKPQKTLGLSDVSLELIVSSGEVRTQAMVELCQTVLVGLRMPAELALSILVSIFIENGDIMNCCFSRAVKLLEHRMKMAKRMLEKRFGRIVAVNEMQFDFTPERGTIDAVFILRRLQGEYYAKGEKFYMCFVALEKAFERVVRKVLEWAMRKKGIPEFFVRSVMSLYEGQRQDIK